MISPGSTSRRPNRVPVVAAVLLAVSAVLGGLAVAQVDHTAGFTRYARVDRADGTYREMLIDDATLAALRAGRPPEEGATILMESYYSPGEIGSIFARRLENGRWLYGSFRPGEPLPAVASRPQCALCHRGAEATGGTFTLPMLERFARTGTVQRTDCDRSGRTPCDPPVYSGR